MFKVADIVIRKDREPKHKFIVIGFDKDNERLMIVKWLINFNVMNIQVTIEQINREYRVLQDHWTYEENYERKIKLLKLKEKCVK